MLWRRRLNRGKGRGGRVSRLNLLAFVFSRIHLKVKPKGRAECRQRVLRAGGGIGSAGESSRRMYNAEQNFRG